MVEAAVAKAFDARFKAGVGTPAGRGVAAAIALAKPIPNKVPSAPPAVLTSIASTRNWSRMTPGRAPSAFRFPGGESFTEMQARIVGALEEIRDRHPNETVVCVSHADPIKAAVAHALGTHLDLFQRIVISPCSVSVLSWGRSGPVVLTVNSTGAALAGLRPS
jgi:probable phosphoglycerate mutase